MKYETLDVAIPLFPTVSGIIVAPVGMVNGPIVYSPEGGFVKIKKKKKKVKVVVIQK